MADRTAIKAEARRIMRSAQPSAFSASLIVTAIIFAATIPYLLLTANGQETSITFFLDILSALLGWVLSAGLINFLLLLHRGQQASYSDIWDCLGMAGRIIWLQLRIGVQTALWFMLFVIPGLIAAYRYGFAMYFLLDDPSISAGEALRRSCERTNGWKGELFMLELSFILPMLLCVGVPALVVGAFSAIGSLGMPVTTLLTLAAVAAPVAWLQAYMVLSQIGLYRQAVGDIGSAEATGENPWEF